MYGTIRQTFAGVKVRREVKTFCRKCKRKMKRVLVDEYYLNGLHNETETHAKYVRKQAKQAREMELNGIVCLKCE